MTENHELEDRIDQASKGEVASAEEVEEAFLNTEESYAEQTVLTSFLGNHPKVKILAVLLVEPRDINITKIADMGGMSRTTVYNHIRDLQALDVVIQSREVGGSPLYTINEKSEVAKLLANLEHELIKVIETHDADDILSLNSTAEEL
jgi:DNA-binding transcriptional ArsR family regulator